MGTENQISQEAAEEQIDLLEDYCEKSPLGISEAELAARAKIRGLLTFAVMKGRLEITGEGQDVSIIQHVQSGESTAQWNYTRVGAAGRLAFDKGKTHMESIFLLCASLTNTGYKAVIKLNPDDLSVAENLATFLRMD